MLLTACGNSDLMPIYEKNSSGVKWGYAGRNGEYVIEPKFALAKEFSEGFACVKDPESDRYGYINKSGEWVIEPQFYNACSFNDGLAAVCDAGSELWGYIDPSGEWSIEPQFSDAGTFDNGYAAVMPHSAAGLVKYGVIRSDGKMVVPAKYDDILVDLVEDTPLVANDNFIAFDGNKGYMYVDKTGKYKGECRSDEARKAAWDFNDGPFYMYDEGTGRVWFVNSENKVVIDNMKNNVLDFTDNRNIVYTEYPGGDLKEDADGYSGYIYGFMDETGEMCTDMEFFAVPRDGFFTGGCAYKNNRVLVRTLPDKNGKINYGYIDKNGKWIIKKEYDMELDYDVRWQ